MLGVWGCCCCRQPHTLCTKASRKLVWGLGEQVLLLPSTLFWGLPKIKPSTPSDALARGSQPSRLSLSPKDIAAARLRLSGDTVCVARSIPSLRAAIAGDLYNSLQYQNTPSPPLLFYEKRNQQLLNSPELGYQANISLDLYQAGTAASPSTLYFQP